MDRLLIKLANLAIRTEGKGQYNIAKHLRATLDSLLRQAAFKLGYAPDTTGILSDLASILTELEDIGYNRDTIDILRLGYQKIASDAISKMPDFATPRVCRRCGHIEPGRQPNPSPHCPDCGADIASFVSHQPIYWIREFDPLESLTQLKQTPLKYEELLSGIPAADHMIKPSPEEWSVLEILKHIRDAESVLHFRVKKIIGEDNPFLDFQKVWDWTEKTSTTEETPGTVLDVYRASRAETIKILEDTPLYQWWRTAIHEEFGPVTLIGQVSYFAAHEISHIRQLTLRAGFVKRIC